MRRVFPILGLLSVLVAYHLPSFAAPPPMKIGSCSDSFVQSKRFRIVPSPGDSDYKRTNDNFGKEVFILLTNGLGIFAGEGDDFVLSGDFAPGHKVKVCLESFPKDCPPGDNRGKGYSFYDYLTRARISGVDSWHMCGGA